MAKKSSAIDALQAEINEFREEFKKKGQKLLNKTFKDVFNRVPNLMAVKWTQYTPYFNDGEECTFRIGDVYFKLEDSKEDSGDYEDGFESTWSLDRRTENKVKKEDIEAMSELEELIGAEAMEDVLRALFDDHVEVTYTDGEFTADEYDHE